VRWFTLDRVDLDYGRTGPHRVCHAAVLDVPPARVFEVLTGDGWLEWFPDMRQIEWSPPRGVGGTRHVRLGHSEARERFLAWEPATRFAFSVERSTVRALKAILVDFRLTPIADGRRARVDLCWHYELRGAWRPLHFLVRRRFRVIVEAALAGLEKFVNARSVDRDMAG